MTLYRGDSYHWQLFVWLDAGKTEPLDLTDIDVAASMKDPKAGIVPFDCTKTGNQIDMVLSSGVCATLTVTSSPTTLWDLQLTYPSGDVKTIIGGKVSVTGDVTP